MKSNYGAKIKKTLHQKAKTTGHINHFFSIRFQLIGCFIILIILMIILGVMSYLKSSNGLISNYESSTINTLNMMGNYIKQGLSALEDKATLLNSDDFIRNYYSGYYKDDKGKEIEAFRNVQNSVQSYAVSDETVYNVLILPKYGYGLAASGVVTTYDEYAATEQGAEFIESRVRAEWIGNHNDLDTIRFSVSNGYCISYIRYLYGTNNKPVAALIIDVSYSFVDNILKETKLADGSISAFITSDGREIINGKIDEGYVIGKQAFYQKALKGEHKSGNGYVEINGKDYLFIYSKLEDQNSMLCALVPEGEIIKEANEVKVYTVGLIIMASIIAISIGTIMALGISNTIQNTNNVLEKTASGDLTAKVIIKRKDEFLILGQSINKMIRSMMNLIQKMTGVSKTVSESAKEVSDNSGTLLEATRSISCAVNEIEQGIMQQAEDAERCLGQMNSLAEQIADVYLNTNEIEKVTGDTKQTIEEGIVIVDNLGNKVRDTSNITQEVIMDIEKLESTSKAITIIISTMNEIASQTNLLALNATIEAARVGNAGRAFTVVADEIRKLAEQSVDSSNQIGEIIKNIHEQMIKTVETARRAENIVATQEEALASTVRVFEKIDNQVNGFSINLQQISKGIEHMEHVKDDTLSAVQNMSATSQQTAAVAEELNVNAEYQLKVVEVLNRCTIQLGSDAQVLQQTVKIFKVTTGDE